MNIENKRNKIWEILNTDINTGKVQTKILGIPNGISAQEIIPQEMKVESLKDNYQAIRNKLLEIGNKKFTKEEVVERLNQVPKIKKQLLSQPLIHMTHEDKLPQFKANSQTLLSYKKVIEIDQEITGNTFGNDIATGRDQFVYLSFGSAYLGGGNQSTGSYALAYRGDLLNSRDCIVQDPNLGKLLDIKAKEDNNYEHLNNTSICGEDWLKAVSVGLALEVFSYNDLADAEIMIKDKINPRDLEAIINFYGDGNISKNGKIDEINLKPEDKFKLQDNSLINPFNRDKQSWQEQLIEKTK
jgi:hypothetical protein